MYVVYLHKATLYWAEEFFLVRNTSSQSQVMMYSDMLLKYVTHQPQHVTCFTDYLHSLLVIFIKHPHLSLGFRLFLCHVLPSVS